MKLAIVAVVSAIGLFILSYVSLVRDPVFGHPSPSSVTNEGSITAEGVFFTTAKFAAMMYVLYILSRLTIGVPQSERWYVPNIRLAAVTIISIIASMPIAAVFVLKARGDSETKASAGTLTWVFVIIAAVIISGGGHVWAAGMSAHKPASLAFSNIVLAFAGTIFTGALLVAGGAMHFSLVNRMMKSPRRTPRFHLLDAANASFGSVITFLGAASVWRFM